MQEAGLTDVESNAQGVRDNSWKRVFESPRDPFPRALDREWCGPVSGRGASRARDWSGKEELTFTSQGSHSQG